MKNLIFPPYSGYSSLDSKTSSKILGLQLCDAIFLVAD